MQPDLDFVIDISKHAGQILREMHRKQIDVQHKDITDLVTAADKAAETFLLDEILSKFPSHSINSEESGKHEGDPNHKWYIDPLDGTLNYAHGMPMFSTSIGYALNGKLELGVIYDPLLDEMFSAQRGHGAFVNGKRLQVSKNQDLIDCLLVTSFKRKLLDTMQSNIDNFFRLSKLTQGVRRLGSAAINLAYVAAGRLDGYWDVTLSQWDAAAGILLVEEAGGVVTKMYGEPDPLNEPVSILAANPTIHSLILEELSALRKQAGW